MWRLRGKNRETLQSTGWLEFINGLSSLLYGLRVVTGDIASTPTYGWFVEHLPSLSGMGWVMLAVGTLQVAAVLAVALWDDALLVLRILCGAVSWVLWSVITYGFVADPVGWATTASAMYSAAALGEFIVMSVLVYETSGGNPESGGGDTFWSRRPGADRGGFIRRFLDRIASSHSADRQAWEEACGFIARRSHSQAHEPLQAMRRSGI